MRTLLRVIRNCIIGLLGLYLFNLLAADWGLSLGINVFNTLMVGLLGIPGFAALLLLRLMAMR